MSIAEKLTTIAENQQKVYDAGYAAGKAEGGGGMDILQYATRVNQLFQSAAFPENSDLMVNLSSAPTSLAEMFRMATGIRKLTLDVPVSVAYNATYFFYGPSTASELEEIHLPDLIKFSNFTNFAARRSNLRIVSGTIDLLESTSNASAFHACPALTEVRFVANSIIQSISFGHSADLSDASIESIVGGLGLAENETQTLTLHSDVVAKLTEDQLVLIQEFNWTL